MANFADNARTRKARTSFWRLIVYLGIAGVSMMATALYFLLLYGPLTPTLVSITGVDMFISILLWGGLMAAGFRSSNSGHGERAASATKATPLVEK